MTDLPHILIVEDSPTQAERLQIILQEAGFMATVAVDASDALARMLTTTFDLIVSDIVMPGRSGYELCREIKANPEWRSTPVVLLTSRKDPMDIFRGLECGADNFYTKPYDAPRLIERVRTILTNRALRANSKVRMGIEFSIFGQRFVIGSEKEQIIDLLISTFEDVVQTNLDLERARDELVAAKSKLEEYAARLENRAYDSEQRHQAILESVSESILVYEESGRIKIANPAAVRMFRLGGEERSECWIGDLLKPIASDTPIEEIAAYRPALASADPYHKIEYQGCGVDGREFPAALSVSEMILRGRREFVGVVRDLTIEREIEANRSRSQKMEAMGQLTGGVAHDFNNLLTVILGNADLLLELLPPDARARSLAEFILGAAQRGADLTQRLLAFSRRQALAPRPIDLNGLVRELTNMLQRTLGNHIEVETELFDGLWPSMVDPTQLENALLNLCINARDAMPDGGRVRICTDNEVLDRGYASVNDGVIPGAYAVISVSDSGMGISPEALPRVFEPFFTTKDIGKGTGLGLSMVHGFVNQSRGHVSIDSETGIGTTVKLYLPRTANHEQIIEPAETPSSLADQIGSETILLVEDEAIVREYAAHQLATLGYQVRMAQSGLEALNILKQDSEIRLLFTDIIMPGGMNGRQLAEAAQRIRPGLKVLYTSGYCREIIVHHGRLDPDTEFLAKPYRRSELARHLRAAFGEPKAKSEGA